MLKGLDVYGKISGAQESSARLDALKGQEAQKLEIAQLATSEKPEDIKRRGMLDPRGELEREKLGAFQEERQTAVD